MELKEEFAGLFADREIREYYAQHFDSLSTSLKFDIVGISNVDIREKRRLYHALIEHCEETSHEAYAQFDYERERDYIRERQSELVDAYWIKRRELSIYGSMLALDRAVEELESSHNSCFDLLDIAASYEYDDRYRITHVERGYSSFKEAIEDTKREQESENWACHWLRIKKLSYPTYEYRYDAEGNVCDREKIEEKEIITYLAKPDGTIVDFTLHDAPYSLTTSTDFNDYDLRIPSTFKTGDVVEIDLAPFGPKIERKLEAEEFDYVDGGMIPFFTCDENWGEGTVWNACGQWLLSGKHSEYTPDILRLPYSMNTVFTMKRAGCDSALEAQGEKLADKAQEMSPPLRPSGPMHLSEILDEDLWFVSVTDAENISAFALRSENEPYCMRCHHGHGKYGFTNCSDRGFRRCVDRPGKSRHPAIIERAVDLGLSGITEEQLAILDDARHVELLIDHDDIARLIRVIREWRTPFGDNNMKAEGAFNTGHIDEFETMKLLRSSDFVEKRTSRVLTGLGRTMLIFKPTWRVVSNDQERVPPFEMHMTFDMIVGETGRMQAYAFFSFHEPSELKC